MFFALEKAAFHVHANFYSRGRGVGKKILKGVPEKKLQPLLHHSLI